jgi:hypothetical protein
MEQRRLLSNTQFTIVPAQSKLALTVQISYPGLGSSTMTAQGTSTINSSENSLTTHFTGTLLASVGASTLQFIPTSSIDAEVNGKWDPGSNINASGNTTAAANADYGGVDTILFVGTEYSAIRNLAFDWQSPVLNKSGSSFTTDNLLEMNPTVGDVYYQGISQASGYSSLAGDSDVDQSGSGATVVISGSTETLTVPISVHYSQTVSSATITSSFVGTLVATATVINNSPSYDLKLDSDRVHVDVYNNSTGTGTIAEQFVLSQQSSVALTTTAGTGNGNGTSSITIDNSAGNVIPSSGFTLSGNGNTSLLIIGTGLGDTVSQSSGLVSFNSLPIAFSGIAQTSLNPNGGTDSLTVNSGQLMLTAVNAGQGIVTREFSSISIGSGAELVVLTAASHSDRSLLVVNKLTIAGSSGGWTGLLDLGGNDMDLQTGSLATVSSIVAAGFSFGRGAFTPLGISSSTAIANTAHLTSLGVIQNNQSGQAIFGSGVGQSQFDLTSPGAADILVKYTYFGDTNLDGKVNGSDYSRIDSAFHNASSGTTASSGWFNGDYNYDGAINGSDYTLMDNAFNMQSTSLAAEIAQPAIAISGHSTIATAATDPATAFSGWSQNAAQVDDFARRPKKPLDILLSPDTILSA